MLGEVKKVTWRELGCFDGQQRKEADQLLRRWVESLCLYLEGWVMAEYLCHHWDGCLASVQCKETWITPLESTFLSSDLRYPKEQRGFLGFALVLGLGWIWSSEGMILKGENRNMRSKTCRNVTLSTENFAPTWNRPWASAVTGRRLSALVLYSGAN